jgi:hypothetical protein
MIKRIGGGSVVTVVALKAAVGFGIEGGAGQELMENARSLDDSLTVNAAPTKPEEYLPDGHGRGSRLVHTIECIHAMATTTGVDMSRVSSGTFGITHWWVASSNIR